jgi:hypothetical protein
VKSFWSLARIIDLKSLLISGLAVAATWWCLHYRILGEFPLTLIATAIVFPLVFSISTAYRRREKALEDYGTIKAHGRALHYAARDWLPQGSEARSEELKRILFDLLSHCRDMFTSPIDDMPPHQQRIHQDFSRLSLFVERLRAEGLSANECSRCNQYLSKIMAAYESIRHIYQYRTPRTLRTFSDFFILVLPILYAPYFAYEASRYSPGLAYVMPVLFTIILIGLANIQKHLENPFDQIGEDDVAINPDKFVDSLRGAEGDPDSVDRVST